MTSYLRPLLATPAATALGALLLTAPANAQCTCVGDINGDGVVNGADLGILLAHWGSTDNLGDLNGSGIVDGADLGILLGDWGVCPPLTNNSCATATVVTEGWYPFCTGAASSTPLPLPAGSCGAYATDISKDIWFSYTAWHDGWLWLDTCSDPGFDTVIAIYTTGIPGVDACPQAGGGGLSQLVACSDDDPDHCASNPLASLAVTNVEKGVTYKIRVGGYNGAAGASALSVIMIPYGFNCGTPIDANNNLYYQHIVDNNSQHYDFDSNVYCVPSDQGGFTEWVRWKPICTGTATISTCNPGTDFDTVVTVFIENGDCDMTEIACDDDSNQSGACMLNGQYRKSYLNVPVNNTTSYLIRVSGYGANSVGNWDLTLSLSCP